MPVYVVYTGPDETVKFAVKRKAEDGTVSDKSSPVKMKIKSASSKGTSSGISIKVGQLVSFVLKLLSFVLVITVFTNDILYLYLIRNQQKKVKRRLISSQGQRKALLQQHSMKRCF